MDIIFALLTGITSAVIYSLIQALYLYFRWSRTRRFFLSEIKESITYLDYYVKTILDINPIYDTEYESDHLMDHEEFISEIESLKINKQQYERLNNVLKYTRNKIEKARKEALTIPTFTSKDFHAIDKFIMEVSMFLSSYSLTSEEINDLDISNRLKRKLIDILNIAEENPFPNNFLDNIRNWQRRKVFSVKRNYKKHIRGSEVSDESYLPF